MEITVSRKPVADQLDAVLPKNDACCFAVWETQVTENETCNLRQDYIVRSDTSDNLDKHRYVMHAGTRRR